MAFVRATVDFDHKMAAQFDSVHKSVDQKLEAMSSSLISKFSSMLAQAFGFGRVKKKFKKLNSNKSVPPLLGSLLISHLNLLKSAFRKLGFIKLFSSFVNDVKILNLIILWSLLPNFSLTLSLDIVLSSEENTRSKVLLPLVGLSTHCVKYSSLANSNNRILSASAVCVFQLTEQLKSPATMQNLFLIIVLSLPYRLSSLSALW